MSREHFFIGIGEPKSPPGLGGVFRFAPVVVVIAMELRAQSCLRVSSTAMSNSDHVDRAGLAFVCVGAGRGRRFGSDKVSEKLGGRTVLEISIVALRTAIPEAPVVAVVAPDTVEWWRQVLEPEFSEIRVVSGGTRRQDSVRRGVERAVEWGAEVVVIHDAARPLVHSDDICRLIDAMDGADAVILTAAVSDTVKRVDANGIIRETVDRGSLRLAQTPQAFRVAVLETAWRRQDWSREWSDEAALLEADGCEVRSIVADYPNPKLTTAGDLDLARFKTGDVR